MTHDDSRRAIIEILGLSPQVGAKLVEALDSRFQRRPSLSAIAEAQMHANNLDAVPVKVGDVVPWSGVPHRVVRCEDGAERCLSCERRGWHLEPATRDTGARVTIVVGGVAERHDAACSRVVLALALRPRSSLPKCDCVCSGEVPL